MSKYNLSIQYKGNIGYCFLDSFNGYYIDDNGTKARKVTLLSGELSGGFMEWYSNGKNKEIGNYLPSGKQIIVKKWSENGELILD